MLAGAAEAAELVMFRRDSCPWCALWDREIGPIYPKTDIGRRVPLRMVDLDRERLAGVRTRGPIHYTPTFVLVEKGEEVGRIEGYPGDAFFWGLLERLVEQLPSPARKGASAPGAGGLFNRERML
jgi:thioredoxin-related protein